MKIFSLISLIALLGPALALAEDARYMSTYNPAGPAAPTTAWTPTAAATSTATYSFSEDGLASWYGAEFAGRPTSNGEIYDPRLLTAAHPSLPFGTVVLVTNLQNGKQIQVRVNDRGPFKVGRIIDLSQAAAAAVNLVGQGVTKVHIEAAGLPTSPVTTANAPVATTTIPGSAANTTALPSAATPTRTVQIISFSTQRSADTLNSNLRQLGFASAVEPVPTGFFRVIVPSVALPDLPATLERLKTAGFPEVLVRQN